MSVVKEFKSTKQLILHVLEHHPETRNSDNKLFIQCAKYLGAETLDDVNKINLNMITVHKVRQIIQNKDGLFKADKEVHQTRSERESEIRRIMR